MSLESNLAIARYQTICAWTVKGYESGKKVLERDKFFCPTSALLRADSLGSWKTHLGGTGVEIPTLRQLWKFPIK